MKNEIMPKYRFVSDNLPKTKQGVDWKGSIGFIVGIIYEYVFYEFKILDYEPKKGIVYLEYNGNKLKPICTSNLRKCAIGSLIGKITKDFKIKIGTIFKDGKRDLTIKNREYRKRTHSNEKSIINEKWYKYKCNKCGYEGWIDESGLLNGVGCSCCCNPPKVVVPEINSIWAMNPWMIKLGVSEEDAKKYTSCSGAKIEVTCQDCGLTKKIPIYKIYERKSISCTCGDGFSYPEKFMTSMLTQLNENFETQYSPNYMKRKENGKYSKKYSDFYLPDYKLVIETDGGLGHKGGKTYSKSNKTIDGLVEVDKWKDEQHSLHGIKTIRINCFKSDVEYIKENILNSELVNIFDLSQIDWNKCEEYALNSNKVKEVCDYWNNKDDSETTMELAIIFRLHRSTITNYLKKGSKINLCNYDPEEELRKGRIKNNKLKTI